VRLGAVLLLAACTLWRLLVAGSAQLGTPPIGSWGAAEAWYQQVGAARAVIVMARLVAIVGAGWLAAGATLQLVASLSLSQGVHRLADAVSPRVLRRLAQGAASLSITAGLTLPTAALNASPVNDPPGTAVMEMLGDLEPTTTTVPPDLVPAPSPLPEDEVVVQRGDSFWAVAVDVVAEASGSVPSERQVIHYWERLIEANRERLVAPANPDLLFPGQVLVLPAV
jgi:hypothetical protein